MEGFIRLQIMLDESYRGRWQQPTPRSGKHLLESRPFLDRPFAELFLVVSNSIGRLARAWGYVVLDAFDYVFEI